MENSILEQVKVAEQNYMLQFLKKIKKTIQKISSRDSALSIPIVKCPYFAFLVILCTLKNFKYFGTLCSYSANDHVLQSFELHKISPFLFSNLK